MGMRPPPPPPENWDGWRALHARRINSLGLGDARPGSALTDVDRYGPPPIETLVALSVAPFEMFAAIIEWLADFNEQFWTAIGRSVGAGARQCWLFTRWAMEPAPDFEKFLWEVTRERQPSDPPDSGGEILRA